MGLENNEEMVLQAERTWGKDMGKKEHGKKTWERKNMGKRTGKKTCRCETHGRDKNDLQVRHIEWNRE